MNHGHVRRKKRTQVKINFVPELRDAETQTYTYYPPRGEKLYVTKDKRRPASWRRCLSWIVACTVISVVLIVAILAGTGTILSQDSNMVQEASIGRNFAGANIKPSVTDKPTAEMYMYVPRSIESEFVIDNLEFDPALMDRNSSAYQEFSSAMENQLKMLLFDKETLETGASEVGLRIVNISHDPFKVNYRIGWNYKQGAENPPEPIKMEDVKKRLVESLARNQGYIDKYHIDREAIKVNHVIDACQMENGGCSHICYYNYNNQQFTCTCPTHLVLDHTGKNCVAWTGSSEEDGVPVPSHGAYPDISYETSGNSDEYEITKHHDHGVHHGVHHEYDVASGPDDYSSDKQGDREPAAEPEPTPEPGSDRVNGYFLGTGHDHDHSGEHESEKQKEHEPSAEPEPTAEPSPDHSSGYDYNSNDKNLYIHSYHEMKDKESAPEPAAEPNSEGKHDGHFFYGSKEPSAEPTPEPAPEPTPEPSSDLGHDVLSVYNTGEAEPSAEPTPEPSPESGSSEGRGHGDVNYSVHVHDGLDSTTGKSDLKTHENIDHSIHGSLDSEPAAEPTPEPAPEPSAEPTPEPAPEPSAEPTADNKHDGDDHSVVGSWGSETSAEPTPEPQPTSDTEKHDHSTYEVSDHESAAPEPTPEPTVEESDKKIDTQHSTASKVAEPESAAEPTAEPTPKEQEYSSHIVESGVDGEKTKSEHSSIVGQTSAHDENSEDQYHLYAVESVEGLKEHKPAIEPTPGPVSQSTTLPNTESQDNHQMHETEEEISSSKILKSGVQSGTSVHDASHQGSEDSQTKPPVDSINNFKNSNPESSTEAVLPNQSVSDSNTVPDSKSSSDVPENQQNGGTLITTPVNENKNSESNTPGGSNPENTFAPQEPIQMSDAKTEVPEKTSQVTSGHNVPYLEDILIKQSSPNSENQNLTVREQNILNNVKLDPNGQPIVEDIVINKSEKPMENQHEITSHSLYPGQADTSSESASPVTSGNLDNQNEKFNAPSTESLNMSEAKQHVTENPSIQSIQSESVTEVSSIIDYSTKDDSKSLKGESVDTEHPQAVQGSSVSGPVETSHFMNVETSSEAVDKLMDPTTQKVLSTSQQPSHNHESHTIPVSIEFLNPANSGINTAPELTSHNVTEEPSNAMNKREEGVVMTDLETKNQPDSKNTEGASETLAVVSHETVTESKIHVTTLNSILTPESATKITESKDGSVKTPEGDTKDQSESHDTTKSPEEFSNNIKDELLDNEEFNTLIDQDSTPGDGKDFYTKFTKGVKTEKKKVKDYPKGEKIDSDKKGEVTARPSVTPEELILQKDLNGNDHTQDLEFSLQNEHTTKHDGGITVVDPHRIEGVPGVSIAPHEINNHDLNTFQTVAPDFKTETIYLGGGQDFDSLKPESKSKFLDSKEGDSKLDKDFKFDKDYKYEKQKGSKKKDFKKKSGGKDGKNFELDDGRRYYTETSKEELDSKEEDVKDDVGTTVNPLLTKTDKMEMPSGSFGESSASPDLKVYELNPVGSTSQSQPSAGTVEMHTVEDKPVATEHPDFKVSGGHSVTDGQSNGSGMLEVKTERILMENDGMKAPSGENVQVGDQVFSSAPVDQNRMKAPSGEHAQRDDQAFTSTTVDQNGHQLVDEPLAKSTTRVKPGTVFDGHFSGNSEPDVKVVTQQSDPSLGGSHGSTGSVETVFDGIPQHTTIETDGATRFENFGGVQNGSFVIYKTLNPTADGIMNYTSANPTIVIHGQRGNLQDGHTVRVSNTTFFDPKLSTTFNGSFTGPNGETFTFTNYTTLPNGTTVHPTIVIRGQSGALQDGHNVKLGNSTFKTFTTPDGRVFTTSNIFRIENGSQPLNNGRVFTNVYRFENGSTPGSESRIFTTNFYRFENGSATDGNGSHVFKIETGSAPGTVFDGNFNPENGHYHMFTNASGTFVYTNTTTPTFFIKGSSGDFGNSTAYVVSNKTSFTVPHSVIFRNSTVFAMGNTEDGGDAETREYTVVPVDDEASNETIRFTHQMSPSFVSSGTAYKVNNYFGYISKCAAGQFQCVNGTSKRGSACINLSSKCDSINDCSDGSDELGCIENGCPGNFQCSDSTCLKRNLVCNGIADCSDGGDEKNCEEWKCEFDEFRCPSGRCIPILWQCDNKPDCDNHTDEYNCQTSCGNDEYLCPEGWCIPLTYKCNGIKECSNGEDEQLCDCSHEEFKCQTGGCVSMSQVCNGLDDCPDRSDEWDCVKINPDSNQLQIRSASGSYEPVCADNWTPRHSDEVCASLGYFSAVPAEKESSTLTTDSSFYILKNDTTVDFNKKIIANLMKSEGNCSSGKAVEISCQEFSCGSRSMTDSSSVEARLVGGMSAAAGQWPSVALLYNTRNFHSCTANIITPRWVLVSYNCLKMGNKNINEQDWKFFGGSTVFEAEKENAETRKIVSIVPHPQMKFNQFLFANDLALVELDQSLQFTSKLGAVCLPEQEMQPRQICVTAGWEIKGPEEKAMRQQLQYLPVPTMNLTECNSTEHYSGFITDDKICAGYNSAQKSLCYNEEGAPLMCVNDKGEWELQGVLSYHSNCGRGSHPSIFSSITPVSDWIKKTIGNTFDRKPISVANR